MAREWTQEKTIESERKPGGQIERQIERRKVRRRDIQFEGFLRQHGKKGLFPSGTLAEYEAQLGASALSKQAFTPASGS